MRRPPHASALLRLATPQDLSAAADIRHRVPIAEDDAGVVTPFQGRIRCSSIDIYLTFRCGLRCTHCFVGPQLESNRDMPFEVFQEIVSAIPNWGAREVTFLGGEPTLYPRFSDALKVVHEQGFHARIVTNGQQSLLRLITKWRHPLPFLSFSIDGAEAATHDAVRGNGTFEMLLRSMRAAKSLGYRFSAITSISCENAAAAPDIVSLCNEFGCEYLNVHHVSKRGHASHHSVLGPNEWDLVVEAIKHAADAGAMPVRLEETFTTGRLGADGHQSGCAVRNRSNLMFLPDGRVFSCMLFIDIPSAHSFTWQSGQLVPNTACTSETHLTSVASPGCPALRHVDPQLADEVADCGRQGRCIYDKTEINVLAGQRGRHHAV